MEVAAKLKKERLKAINKRNKKGLFQILLFKAIHRVKLRHPVNNQELLA
jgi:hypothetical protein